MTKCSGNRLHYVQEGRDLHITQDQARSGSTKVKHIFCQGVLHENTKHASKHLWRLCIDLDFLLLTLSATFGWKFATSPPNQYDRRRSCVAIRPRRAYTSTPTDGASFLEVRIRVRVGQIVITY